MKYENEILKYLEEKKECTLKDIYVHLPYEKSYMIRTTLNFMVKHGKIQRKSRGNYSAKNDA